MLPVPVVSSKHAKPNQKSPLQLIGINSLVCGIEIASSCAFTYISPMLLKAGFSETSMTIILGIAPVIALVTVPVLADWSDQCRSRYGRRQPFIVGLSILVAISLVLISVSSILFVKDLLDSQVTYMVLLATAVITFDYSYQALFNPCESLLVDVVASQNSQQSLAFTIYSACLSLGCIIGYFVVSINWSTVLDSTLTREQWSFFIVAVLFLICLGTTLVSSTEKSYFYYSNELLEDKDSYKLNGFLSQSDHSFGHDQCLYFPKPARMGSWKSIVKKVCHIRKFLFVGLWKVIMLPVVCCRKIRNSPWVIRQLFFTELFGWTSILCHNLFFTDFVAQYIYHGVPRAAHPSHETMLYDEGVAVGSWALFLQSLTAFSYAFLVQQNAVKILGVKLVFLLGMLAFGVCMIGTIFCSSVTCLNVYTAVSGVGLAALTTVPNMLVTLYNQNHELFLWDSSSHKSFAYGSHVAILDSAYFLSQVLLSVLMGPIVDYSKSSLSYLVVSALTCFVSIGFGFGAVYSHNDMPSRNG